MSLAIARDGSVTETHYLGVVEKKKAAADGTMRWFHNGCDENRQHGGFGFKSSKLAAEHLLLIANETNG